MTVHLRRILLSAVLCAWCWPNAGWASQTDVPLSSVVAARARAVSGQAPSLFVPPSIETDEGATLNVQVTATDPDSTGHLEVTLSSPLALGLQVKEAVSPSLVIADLVGAIGFSDAGTYKLLWSATDGVNSPVTATTTLTIRDVPPSPSAPLLSVYPNELLLDVRANVFIK